MQRQGFTLPEIAVSLALVAVGVMTIFLMVPQGIKTQTLVRYKVLASAKAQELANILRQHQPGMAFDARDQDKEGIFPWDTRTSYKSMAPDMESLIENLRGTIKPLPEEIAYRLESDNDEIRSLLDAGGRLYYFYPGLPAQGLEAVRSAPMDINWTDDARKLVVGIVGNPQQNSILYHPSLKVGPYQDFYPSPPSHGRQAIMEYAYFDNDFHDTSDAKRTWVRFAYDALCRDPDIAPIHSAYLSFAQDSDIDDADSALRGAQEPTKAKAYFQAALTYALVQGFEFGSGNKDLDLLKFDEHYSVYLHAPRPIDEAVVPTNWNAATRIGAWFTEPPSYDPSDGSYDATQWTEWPPLFYQIVRDNSTAGSWKRVLAMRFLAHAGMTLMANDITALNGAGSSFSGAGIPGTQRVQVSDIQAWHEASVQMGIRHADQAGPYHWGAPRPLNRQVMMDHPLVQLDIWSSAIRRDFEFRPSSGQNTYPLGFTASGSENWPPHVTNNVVTRRGWKAVFGNSITTPGQSSRPWMYPGRELDVDGDGDIDANDLNLPGPSGLNQEAAIGNAAHFNLTAPFTPQERCRQMVFWAVDWQSYIDFESAGSARIDGSRYPIPAPVPRETQVHETVAGSNDTMPWSQSWVTRSDYRRVINAASGMSALSNSSRNPELLYSFILPSRDYDPTSQDFTGDFYENNNSTTYGFGSSAQTKPLNNDMPIMSEINVFLDGRRYSIVENNWFSLGIRMIDLRSETSQNSRGTRLQSFIGHHGDLWNPMIFLGKYGANRNGVFDAEWVRFKGMVGQSGGGGYKNVARVDQGTIPASVRLRATTVARFNFYDPRLSGGIFH